MKEMLVVLGMAFILQPFQEDDIDKAVRLLPESYRENVKKVLEKSGKNSKELIGAINEIKEAHREGIAFLLANMEGDDLKKLKKDFLVENVEYAYLAREKLSWGKDIPNEIFLRYVLPYANLQAKVGGNVRERRDQWRKDFYDKFLETAEKCKTPAEAVRKLNEWVIDKVKYDPAKTMYPYQSPYESLKNKFATCTGLSTLLVDACRSVCIPARLAGTPFWKTRSGGSGNHVWAEVWIGEWFYTGGGEPNELNKTWFDEDARHADKIYAVSFEKRKKKVNLTIAQTYGDDVTKFYTQRRKVKVTIKDESDKVSGGAPLEVRYKDRLIIRKTAGGDGVVEFDIAGGERYQVSAGDTNKGASVELEVPKGKDIFETSVKLKPPKER